MMIPLVSGSFMKTSKQSIKLVPLKGSPPIPEERMQQNGIDYWRRSKILISIKQILKEKYKKSIIGEANKNKNKKCLNSKK